MTQKSSSNAKRHLALTGVLAAAGLVAASLVYLRRKGVDPKVGAKQAKKRAGNAADLLKGESREAYNEVRALILDRLIETNERPTRKVVERTITDALKVLKKRGTLTGEGLRVLGMQLKSDWQTMLRDAERKRVVDDAQKK